jgi:diguanylate cyclase (GGDEF)-like protein
MKQPPAHILVVDDEALVEYLILQKFRREIREQRYSFRFASNGLAALEELRSSNSIDMVLTDIRMPDMDGLTLLEKLNEFHIDTKAVVVSAFSDLRNIRMAMNRGAFDFLTKPIDLADLELTIEKTLRHVIQLRQEKEKLRQAQEQLRYFAFHDVLTNLANRTWFMRQLEQAIDQRQRNPEYTFAVLLLDLDRFKIINDTHGHMVGDYLLIGAASRLQDCLRASDTIARLGGDEFTILIEGVRETELAYLAERICTSFAQPFQIGDYAFHVGVSIGITTSDTGYERAEMVLRDADVAMYRAKQLNEHYALFDPVMHAHVAERLSLETALRAALERGDLLNYYQPIVNFATGQIVGFEVLARWNHATKGWVSPAQFIHIAEEIGVIHQLGRSLLRLACQQFQQWQHQFPDLQISLSINLSPAQLRVPTLASDIRSILEEYSLSGSSLKLELTESALFGDTQAFDRVIYELLDLQIKLCIDDFGTGYSSLSRLHAFPITTLKIDQSFVRQMPHSAPHEATVRVIAMLAEMLGMDVIAEGIETTEETELLREIGCTVGQGYLIAPPLDAQAATTFLAGYLGGGAASG